MTKPRPGAWRPAIASLLVVSAALWIGPANAAEPAARAAAKPAAAPAKNTPAANKELCLACHTQLKEFHDPGKHKGVACSSCHDGIEQHLQDSARRPVTKTDPAVCGACHRNQYETMYKMNYAKTARNEKSQFTGPSPNPAWDKLMTPHGFTREHNVPRSHAFALYDQLVVDRAFGGRFENKLGWEFLAQPGGNIRIWDYLVDKYPGEPHKAFKPGTAAAANPVCMSCKTADHILDWAYLGDPNPKAKWSRTSKVNEFVKDVNHALNCIFCHDPHGAQPRIIRDGLIQALTRPEKDTLWHKDANGAKIAVKDLGMRGFTRKVALLDKYDTKLQCGQCHVEYNCNPGTDPGTGKPIGMDDARTNHFPFKAVDDIGKHYTDLRFRDFRHGITGALLWKAQHPDVEVYYNSPHDKAGAGCHTCHMPKMKDAKTGKTYTSHWQTSPKEYVRQTCLGCHKQWTEKQAVYTIDSLKNRFQGKLRKAEFWLTRFVDKFEEAKNLGLDEATLNAARDKHYDAHVHWEFWTASNGAHFHNPNSATDSINKGMAISQEGIKLLDDAMAKKRGEAKAASAAPMPAPAPLAAPAAPPK
jgi:formate-dependent nitrite reductase cytochrome c552 subunit